MKCLYHPKRSAVAILNRDISKTNIIGTVTYRDTTINFQIGVCLKCFNRWITEKEKEGYSIDGVL